MRVRRTKRGKLSLELSPIERGLVHHAIMESLEPKPTLKTETSVMKCLYLNVLAELALIFWRIDKSSFLLTPAHAISLMWCLRRFDDETLLLSIKSEIHKQLHA